MSHDDLTWWDRFCLQVGFFWEVKALSPLPTPPLPAASAVLPTAPRLEQIVARRCMECYWHVYLDARGESAVNDEYYWRREATCAETIEASSEPLAVVVEFPLSRAECPVWHFIEASVFSRGFQPGLEFMCSGREASFASNFWRLDATALEGPITIARISNPADHEKAATSTPPSSSDPNNGNFPPIRQRIPKQ